MSPLHSDTIKKVSTEEVKFEKIPSFIYQDSNEASKRVADTIIEAINQKEANGEPFVLGLATGSSPIKIYDYLIEAYQNKEVSFKNVYSFNLDEYFPMQAESIHSYVRFMKEHLFDHIDMPKEHIHIPDGSLDQSQIRTFCEDYEEKISELGGIDIQVLGIGRTGHIGFNEPGSSIQSKTRLIRLDKITRLDAASDFFGQENVPSKAITMGVGSIMQAKQIFLVAWGEGKSAIVKKSVEGPIIESIPATFLQQHQSCTFILDEAAGSDLTRIKTPWLVKDCHWDDKLIKKATIWLSEKLDKSILKLTNEDYNEYGMGNLVAEKGSAEDINLLVFNALQRTITGWPGGKPNADDSNRPERKDPFPKRSVIFSPHPDDDVISMGGTLLRLADQGNEVHIAYQTSGNIAVFDDEVIRFMDFAKEMMPENKEINGEYDRISQILKNKKVGEVDVPLVQDYKGSIRKGEALAACRASGVDVKNAHFLNLPFYETGAVKKKPHTDADVKITYDLLQKIKPHQIFAAGDLSDPHGTHRVCLSIIFEAIDQLIQDKVEWIKDCYIWLYRGAWQEWDVSEIEMAVPIGPRDLSRKRNAIFKHQSQKDRAMFPGSDEREFWQRSEDRNRATAKRYDALGLAEYEAIEGFVQYFPQ